MAQLPLKQGSWAIYVPKNDIFCNLLRWFLPIFFLNIKLLFWGIDGATPGVAPSMWAFPAWFWRNDGSYFGWGLRDIDGATHFQGIAMQL